MKILCRAFIILSVFMVSCAGTAPNILHVQAGPMGVSSKKIEINDRYLENNLSYGEVSIKPLGAAYSFEAQVMLTNESMKDLAFEYRFIWYDANGYELSTITSWMPAVLGTKESKGFVSVSPSANAAGFKFMVRMPQPVTGTGS
jgi:uncharacterized protein YcfL